MKLFPIVLTTACLTLTGIAEVPKKAPLTRYSRLYTNSPFTSKPIVAGPVQTENPLNDFALIGVSPLGNDAYRATIINKKKPDERKFIYTDREVDGFKILGVNRKPGDPLGTTVTVASGSITGSVAFDEKLLTLAPPPPPKAAVPQPAQPAVPVQGQQPNGEQQRQPRPRVIPPPAPQVAPAPVADQNNQRPQRRRN